MIRYLFTIVIFLLFGFTLKAQFFQFTQRHFTPQRVSPAKVAAENGFQALLNFRNQSTAGDFSLRSTAIDISYPFNLLGSTVAGLGVFVLDDRTGGQDIFSMQEVGFSGAISIPTSRYAFFNLGANYSFMNHSLNGNGLSTGSQFIPDRGFDTSLDNGEPFEDLRVNFKRINAGMLWKKVDKDDLLHSAYGITVFDLNRPDRSLTGVEQKVDLSFMAEGVQVISQNRDEAWYLEALAYGSAGRITAQGGVIWNREINRDQRLVLKARYSTENLAIVSARIEKDNFVIGATYDIAIGRTSVSNQSAFEVGIGWKGPNKVERKRPKKRRRKRQSGLVPAVVADTTWIEQELEKELANDSSTTEIQTRIEELARNEIEQAEVKEKEQSSNSTVSMGPVRRKEQVVEEFQARYPFEFGSSALTPQYKDFLDQIVTKLKANPDQVIEIIGHADNVGSAEVNLRLSLERAKAVANYLITSGIAEVRVTVDGRGESLPISTNETAKGRALNRRVEIKIKK